MSMVATSQISSFHESRTEPRAAPTRPTGMAEASSSQAILPSVLAAVSLLGASLAADSLAAAPRFSIRNPAVV